VAYAKINLGLPIKAIADRLGMKVKMVEYHWANAQRIIRHQVNNSKL
jgi:DNA-binding CsgD family transcriptional regulator